MRHSQYTANPLNPAPDFIPDTSGQAGCTTYQGDFEDFTPVEIIGKCILISRVYYSESLYSVCDIVH